jgi:MerR family transcriptional regulator, light-induced transcriptional regulator
LSAKSEPAKSAVSLDSTEPSGASIKVVSELTALPMGTLRAWERRYGFPKPTRREGSNRRLYPREQVHRLQVVARALERGYRPGDVIHLSQRQVEALLEGFPAQAVATAMATVPQLVEMLAADDIKSIEDQLRLAAAALGPKRFVTELCQPLAREVGQAWADGKLAIRQEHLLTEILTTQLRALLSTHQAVEGTPTVLLATLPGEPHTLGLQMVALYLAISGAKPRLLGASTPPEQIAAAARAFEATVVGVAHTVGGESVSTQRDLKQLRRALPASVALWLGGAGALLGRLPAGVTTVRTWTEVDAALAHAR